MAWRTSYIQATEHALAALRAQASDAAGARVRRLAEAIDPLLPLAKHGETLSRKALWTLLSTPGVDVALLGMRRPTYVSDALPVLGWDPLTPWREVYDKASG
jgi:aryl-alcohol dehydrogenase-like predicted oxidoreductase